MHALGRETASSVYSRYVMTDALHASRVIYPLFQDPIPLHFLCEKFMLPKSTRSLHDHPHPVLGPVPASTCVTTQLCCCCLGAHLSAALQQAQPATARVSLSVLEL